MKDRERPATRRRILLTSGACVASGLTGCVGKTGGDQRDTEDRKKEREKTDYELEPVAYPDQTCDVDARHVREYPDWNAQILHEDGSRAFFCTSGCMGAYYTSPSSFGVSDADVAGVWVTDYGTGETVDGTEAYYVFVGERDLIDMPAGRNPLPFAERERAEEFTRQFEELSTGDAERFSKYNMNRCVW
jgi:copper chaperone NosL